MLFPLFPFLRNARKWRERHTIEGHNFSNNARIVLPRKSVITGCSYTLFLLYWYIRESWSIFHISINRMGIKWILRLEKRQAELFQEFKNQQLQATDPDHDHIYLIFSSFTNIICILLILYTKIQVLNPLVKSNTLNKNRLPLKIWLNSHFLTLP